MPWRRLRLHGCAAALALAAGCSPTYNWRDVRFDGDAGAAGLTALLPCKPDRAQNPVAFDSGGGAVPVTAALSMIGCNAGGATFTLSHLHVGRGGDANAVLAQWRAATRARLGGAAGSAQPPLKLAGALALAETGRFELEVRAAEPPQRQRAAWFARNAADGGVELFQAAILGARFDEAAAETFFSGLRLAPGGS